MGGRESEGSEEGRIGGCIGGGGVGKERESGERG